MAEAAVAGVVKLSCPYCESRLEVDRLSDYTEYLSLPFGRMPNPPGPNWTRVGSDFLGFLGWDRIGPGILRVSRNDIIFYRAVQCTHCNRPFDAYASKDTTRLRRSVWPHLFYDSDSNHLLPIVLIKRLVGSITNTLAVSVFAGLIHWVLFSIPFLLSRFSDWSTQIIVFLCSVGFASLIYAYLTIVNTWESKNEFAEFLGSSDSNGIAYWVNFQRLRYTGVPKKAGTIVMPISQRSIIGLIGLILYSFLLLYNRAGFTTSNLLDTYDIFIWGVFTYYFFVSIWICFEGPVYVVKIVRKLRPNLSPLKDFVSFSPIERILSVSFIPILSYSIALVAMSAIMKHSENYSALHATQVASTVCIIGAISVMVRVLWDERLTRAIVILLTMILVLFFGANNVEWLTTVPSEFWIGILASLYLIAHFLIVTGPISSIRREYLAIEQKKYFSLLKKLEKEGWEQNIGLIGDIAGVLDRLSEKSIWKSRLLTFAKLVSPLLVAIVSGILTKVFPWSN